MIFPERVLVIDNYDSFTYNLVQYFGEMGADVRVVLNDAIDARQVTGMQPDVIVLSPGPGRPAQAGVTLDIVHQLSGQIPILGVCLGHQAIGEAFGASITGARRLMHGKTSRIDHEGHALFAGIESPFTATRYHSLVLDMARMPASLEVIATSDDGEIMALAHREHCTLGVQFHPESILTCHGKRILANFLRLSRAARPPRPFGQTQDA